MFLAKKEIKYSKGRYALIISVIALISYLVYFLLALSYGLASANKTAIEAWEADGIILSDFANKNLSASTIDMDVYDKMNLKESHPVNVSVNVAYLNGIKDEDNTINASFFGMDPSSGIFPKIIEGSTIKEKDQVVVSKSLIEEKDIKLKDTIKLAQNDRVFTIVGITEDARYITAPAIYSFLEEASKEAMMYKAEDKIDSEEIKDSDKDLDSIDTHAGATPNTPKRITGIIIKEYSEELKNSLEDGLEYVETDDLIKNISGYKPQVATFTLMIGFLVAIVAVIIGIFMYILTIQKKSIFGIMKAQGISENYISLSVLTQSFILTLIGIAIGFLLNYLSSLVLPASVPFKNNFKLYGLISLLILIISLLGSLFSVKTISKIDPLDAIE